MVLVSILVLLDYGFLPKKAPKKTDKPASFNPCFTGLWIFTSEQYITKTSKPGVSILVLLDYGFLPVLTFELS